MALAAGDAVQFQSFVASTPTPPLRGIVVVTGPPAEVVWDNGTRTTVENIGSNGKTEIQEIDAAPTADVLAWLNRRVQLTGGSAPANGGDQARGIVVDVYIGDPDGSPVLTAIVRRLKDGLFYVVDVADIVVV